MKIYTSFEASEDYLFQLNRYHAMIAPKPLIVAEILQYHALLRQQFNPPLLCLFTKQKSVLTDSNITLGLGFVIQGTPLFLLATPIVISEWFTKD